MKKMFSLVFLAVVSLNALFVFAYSPTDADKLIVTELNIKITAVLTQNQSITVPFLEKVRQLKNQYTTNEKLNYILSEIEKNIIDFQNTVQIKNGLEQTVLQTTSPNTTPTTSNTPSCTIKGNINN